MDGTSPTGALAERPAPHDGRRVLVVFHEAELGGASRSVLRVVPLLEERGWSFVFWTPSPGAAQEELEACGYEYGSAPRLLRYTWRSLTSPPGAARRIRSVPGYLRSLRAFADRQSPAIVHANTLLTIPEMIAARRRHRPSLMYAHEILPHGLKGEAAARLIRATADTVVAPSSAAVAALQAHGVDARVVYNGVDPPASAPAQAKDNDRLVVGTLGTVCRRKGSDLFLAAAERVAQSLPDVEFRMIGPIVEGGERSWAEEIVRSALARGIACGASTDVFAELAEWDILVMPSRTEPFPLAALEAMVMGVPVVAADVDGMPEIVDSSTGILVAREDVSALTAAIVALAQDPGRRAELGAAGRTRATETFTLDRQAEGVHRAYLAALAARRR
jgi:glycosyltransferase involved in cell wall biosynthesis